MSTLNAFYASEVALKATAAGMNIVRSGFRTVLKDEVNGYKLTRYLSGQLPYYYRKLDSVIEDFEAQHNALEVLVDLITTAPTVSSFRNSHGGEILASLFLQDKLTLRRLYSKLTMTTSENTNAHKMDGLFVDISGVPYKYIFVEVKTSILPTEATKTKFHRNGILRQMLDSFHSYNTQEPRMEFVRIRENLEATFERDTRERILSDLRMPGPTLRYLGVSVTNSVTVNSDDDDFILSASCASEFDYHGLVVTDLASLAHASFSTWDEVTAQVSGVP